MVSRALALTPAVKTWKARRNASRAPAVTTGQDLGNDGLLAWIKEVFGDNAYDLPANESLVRETGKTPQFHSKDETGKHPRHPRQARRKSANSLQN